MLTKILLTLGVIIICLWMIVSRRNAPQQKSRTNKLSPTILARQKWLRRGAWLFMAFMVIAALTLVMIERQDKNALVTVHVINTQSGERVSYKTRRGDVKQNSFTTTEGRQVFIAGVERIEIEVP